MKTKLPIYTLLLTIVCNFTAFAQVNAVENLTWSQSYVTPYNFFELRWEEPLQPHNELLGYNIYRNDELYRFQTETSLYNLYVDLYGFVDNCDGNFLIVDNQGQAYMNGFEMHVTAVYSEQAESGYLQTAYTPGAALSTQTFEREKAIIFPNPTTGILNIGNKNLEKISVYDISGKMVRTYAPESQIDLSDLSKGMYFIKLFSEKGLAVDKVIIE